MSDPFDAAFGPGRGADPPGSPETELTELRAWLDQWADAPNRVVSVIKHAGGKVGVEVRVPNKDRSNAKEFDYKWWFPNDSPAADWLMNLARGGEARLIGGWDYMAEQNQ